MLCSTTQMLTSGLRKGAYKKTTKRPEETKQCMLTTLSIIKDYVNEMAFVQ